MGVRQGTGPVFALSWALGGERSQADLGAWCTQVRALAGSWARAGGAAGRAVWEGGARSAREAESDKGRGALPWGPGQRCPSLPSPPAHGWPPRPARAGAAWWGTQLPQPSPGTVWVPTPGTDMGWADAGQGSRAQGLGALPAAGTARHPARASRMVASDPAPRASGHRCVWGQGRPPRACTDSEGLGHSQG